jgi:hypothetical protein
MASISSSGQTIGSTFASPYRHYHNVVGITTTLFPGNLSRSGATAKSTTSNRQIAELRTRKARVLRDSLSFPAVPHLLLLPCRDTCGSPAS